jgi:hypothetical protein
MLLVADGIGGQPNHMLVVAHNGSGKRGLAAGRQAMHHQKKGHLGAERIGCHSGNHDQNHIALGFPQACP